MKRPGSLTRSPSRLRREARRRDPERVAEVTAYASAPLLPGQKLLLGVGRNDFHHPISRQECRKHGAPEWDPRNRMAVDSARHHAHHSRKQPIGRDELPASVFEFVADFPALRPYLDRIYPT